MSNDDNSTESVNETNDADNTVETETVVENNDTDNTETVAPEETTTQENAVAKILALKESNPKVFFGSIAGLVGIIVIALSMGGGSSNKHMPVAKKVNLSIGQSYSLKGINSYSSNTTIRLVAVPGSIAAYDDSEDQEGKDPCKHLPEGTKVKLIQTQEAFGKAKFVELEILAGQCKGRKGWANSTNLN